MAILIRKAIEDDAATLASLNADVQAIHAGAMPWLFKPPGRIPATGSHRRLSGAAGKSQGFPASIVVCYEVTP